MVPLLRPYRRLRLFRPERLPKRRPRLSILQHRRGHGVQRLERLHSVLQDVRRHRGGEERHGGRAGVV